MRPAALLSLTVAALLASPLPGCARSHRSALDIASSQPATTAPAPAGSPSTTAPAATPAPSTTSPPPASSPAPVASPAPAAPTSPPPTGSPAPASAAPVATAPAGSPACLAGCNSPSLAPDVQQSCRIQCARLAQQPASPPPAATQPQPDLSRQRALCESSCDAERDAGDRATCRLQCGQAYSSAPQPGGYSTGSPTSYPAGTAATQQQQQQIAACQSQCDREASATDRATCRNNCGAVGTVLGPAGPSGYVLGPAPTMTEAEQRAAVIRSSGGVVGGGPAPATQPGQPQPTAQPANPQCAAQAQGCKLACASEQTACSNQCNPIKSETDRATCTLTCSSSGDMCRDDCRMKEAACKPPTYRP